MVDLVSPSALADFLLVESRDRGELLTNLKLQKLMYYAQAWHLALENSPLFDEDFQAWVHGPVLPSQYHRFKDFQWRPITSEVAKPNLDGGAVSFLSEIVDIFGVETAVSLELMTHREAPWIEARGDIAPDAISNAVISKGSMAKFYSELAVGN